VTLNVKSKIYTLTVLAALLPFLVTLALMLSFRARVSDKAESELMSLARMNTVQSVKDAYALCETANVLVQRRVNNSLAVANRILTDHGKVTLAGPDVQWDVVDPATHQVTRVSLPRLSIGNQWLGQVRNPQAQVPVVDETQKLVGSATVIAQRLNERGDMLAVATTLTGQDGQRAIGAIVPYTLEDGTPNAPLATVLRGDTYQRASNIFGDWFVAAAQPLKDASGKIVGMLFVGDKISSLESLRRAIQSTVIGHTGYLTVAGAKGEHRGRFLITHDGKRDGEYVWETRDPTGHYVVQDHNKGAIAQPPGGVYTNDYIWQNPGETKPRDKMAAVMYFEPWDWILNASVYKDDYDVPVNDVRDAVQSLAVASVVGGLFMLAVVLALAFFTGARISKPIELVTRMAKIIASGDLRRANIEAAVAASHVSRGRFEIPDESHELMESFHSMSNTLESLVGQVQKSGIQVTSSATEIAASARQLEATVAEQAASTREVSATSTQISATSAELLRTMDSVSMTVAETAATAATGHGELGGLEGAIAQLAKSTASISGRLGVINERASKISSVVTAITRISDQTALLSLNAAIEAEKAGEFGKGFSVVAREISRLADQTAVATEDIEGVVRQMQSSVSSGVMEMDRFSGEVRRRVEEVNKIAAQLGQIIDQVGALGPQFATAREGVNAQAQGAQQISEAMRQLAETADQTKEALGEFKQSTEQLNGAVQGLQTQVAGFRLGV
jgi:methyl-accepting chemotaxis protein WspA